MLAADVVGRRLLDLLEQLNLVPGRLSIAAGGLDDFERGMALVPARMALVPSLGRYISGDAYFVSLTSQTVEKCPQLGKKRGTSVLRPSKRGGIVHVEAETEAEAEPHYAGRTPLIRRA
jgi:hypothetical protein